MKSGKHSGKLSRRKRRRRSLLLILVLALLLPLLALGCRIRRLIISMADSGIADEITLCVDRAVEELMEEDFPSYEELIELKTDEEGRVTALITNMALANRTKAYINAGVLRALKDLEYTEIYIPLGSILGSPYFLAKGPRLAVTLLSCTNIFSYFTSAFSAAGINQTRHSIVLHVDVSLDILVAGGVVSSVVSNEISIADTVIVGSVPSSYASLR